MSPGAPVPPERYTKRYFEEDCGGAEFFRLYGAGVLKPALAYCLRRAELRAGMRVLDVGCGRGELLYQARLAGGLGVGTDYASDALTLARRTSGCPVALCDAKALPFRDGAFDRVFFIGVMDHLHDWELERCFSEVGRVLKPGGFALVHTCANRSYYKKLTFGLRSAAARVIRLLGLPLRDPRPPRSAQDEALHVNEHTWSSLRGFFKRLGWEAEVEPRPNDKLLVSELYGEALPEGFPLQAAPAWKTLLYRGILFRGPLKAVLAREFFVLARPKDGARP